ncbi:septation protein A [Notoacmeibacter sp. MSK16QG-6]|uniref:septation protein A n=1 Tax=Notoacmeibacter sp. MSK16QG-6 TaxID=2957982 RepID=UPI0020A1DA80|nr:septation protein A [Notoacmeibacter sp. MSK16QG-6]MCP1199175.1 septation protein A [Notoacmeibacter sp. MSK16QG-6]
MTGGDMFEAKPGSPERRELNPLLKLALELGPLMVFFFANSRGEAIADAFPSLAGLGGPLFIATAAFMVATAIALSVSWALTRKLPIMPLVSGVVVLVFGGLTLWLQDETFIKVKPTIVNGLFAFILLGGLLFGRSLLAYVFDSAFRLTDAGWRKLTLAWGIYFIALAILNEIVWRNFSTDFWVAFKVWGIMPITFAFTLAMLPIIMKNSLPDEQGKKH